MDRKSIFAPFNQQRFIYIDKYFSLNSSIYFLLILMCSFRVIYQESNDTYIVNFHTQFLNPSFLNYMCRLLSFIFHHKLYVIR